MNYNQMAFVFFTTLTLTLAAMWVATAAWSAPTVRDCENHRDTIVVPLAESRDDGMSADDAVRVLTIIGFDVQAAQMIVANIYFYLEDSTPEEIGEHFMHHCAGGEAL